MKISDISTAILKDKLSKESKIFCSGLFLSAKWFVVSEVAKKGVQFIILSDRETAEYCAADLYNLTQGDIVFYLPESGRGIERSNYKSTLGVQRTAALEKLLNASEKFKTASAGDKGASAKDAKDAKDAKEGQDGKLSKREQSDELLYIVSYPEAISEPIPPAEAMKGAILSVSKGQNIKFDEIISTLGTEGFERVDFVSTPGQFAVRGSLIDIFSYAGNEPYRLSFWGDEVEEIKVFDPNTQNSKAELDRIDIISDLLSGGNTNADQSQERSLTDIIPQNATIWLDSSDIYKDSPFYPLLNPYQKVYLDIPLEDRDKDAIQFQIAPQPVFNKNFDILSADIDVRIENGYSIYIFGEKQSQLDRLKSILAETSRHLPEFIKGKNIHAGFIDAQNKICCYTDHEIFERFHRVTMRRTVEKTEQLTLNDLGSFRLGDYVVHIDHGVGTFGGLVKMYDDKGRAKEVVKLVYKDGDVVFVSVHALNKISRYRSADGLPPKINKLGGKAWQTLKSSAKSKVKDIAKDLIRLYAKRRATKGFAYSADSYLQVELESSFMYEDTPDQESACSAVKHDMEETHPMDRLICGDVGFGKTEIAIRAAFKAVCDSKQVAVLVPTTILSLQHYNTFCERLKGFPCNIEYVSRLKSAKQTTEIKEKLRKGQIDIVIGTHKLLGAGFDFKDLGLLIIDEEQKFGVAAKEKLRQIKANVDTLTLTATPIPRTLQFSLLGARDLSIIQTPPPNRIPIQTEIILFDEKEIKSIISYELNRGGQVFFLHNKVEELPSIEDILHRLMPDARICVAHGQMKADDLENRILDFMRGDYDILLCTTIIENGLDIPNANTIIINQAQNIGLSDLHQLRGRVGRSNRKAFCYLIVPPLVSISDDSRRRLKAIEEFSDLGSGFNIAMQDLDIRGAGNLIGAEQSGYITEMGYETFQKIIQEAMEELGIEAGTETVSQNARSSFVLDCTVETDQTALIPDDYIDISAEKIRIYKQLDSMTSDKALDAYAAVVSDRFGPIPTELANLFYVVKIRNLGASLGFEKIIIKNGMFICFFVANAMSPYYSSPTFETVMKKITLPFELKQVENKLKLVARGVNNLENAHRLLGKLK